MKRQTLSLRLFTHFLARDFDAADFTPANLALFNTWLAKRVADATRVRSVRYVAMMGRMLASGKRGAA